MTVISVGRYPYGRCEAVGVLVLIVAAVIVHICLIIKIIDSVCDCMIIGSRCFAHSVSPSVTAFDVTALAAIRLTAPTLHLGFAPLPIFNLRLRRQTNMANQAPKATRL